MGFSRKKKLPPPPLLRFLKLTSPGAIYSQTYRDSPRIFLNFGVTPPPLGFQRFLLYSLEFSINILNRGLQFLSEKAQFKSHKVDSKFQL